MENKKKNPKDNLDRFKLEKQLNSEENNEKENLNRKTIKFRRK